MSCSLPPPSFIHVPFDVLRAIINDACFCEELQPTIHSVLKATMSGAHVTKVMGETQGWRVWDHAPSGVWEKVVTPPPPRARYSGQTCGQHITPMAPCGVQSFLWPPPQSQTSLHQNGQNCWLWTPSCKPRVNSPHPQPQGKCVFVSAPVPPSP